MNVCVAFHPAGTNTPQSQCEIFCLLNFKEVNKGSLILNINKQANILQFLKEYCVLFLILNGVLVCSVSCRVRLYVYVYAYVYVSCLPNLPIDKLEQPPCDSRTANAFLLKSKGVVYVDLRSYATRDTHLVPHMRPSTHDTWSLAYTGMQRVTHTRLHKQITHDTGPRRQEQTHHT